MAPTGFQEFRRILGPKNPQIFVDVRIRSRKIQLFINDSMAPTGFEPVTSSTSTRRYTAKPWGRVKSEHKKTNRVGVFLSLKLGCDLIAS